MQGRLFSQVQVAFGLEFLGQQQDCGDKQGKEGMGEGMGKGMGKGMGEIMDFEQAYQKFVEPEVYPRVWLFEPSWVLQLLAVAQAKERGG